MHAKIALLFVVLWLAGCAGPIQVSNSISSSNPNAPTVWPPQVNGWSPNGTPTLVQLPIIELHTGAQTITGELNEYRFSAQQFEAQQPATRLMLFHLTPAILTATVSQPLSLTTNQTQTPVAWL